MWRLHHCRIIYGDLGDDRQANKGALKHWFPLSAVVRDIDLTGYKRIVMKSDQDNAIADLFRKYKDSQDRVEVMIEHSPIGDSQANGDAERAVRSAQGFGRTLKDFLKLPLGRKCRRPTRIKRT